MFKQQMPAEMLARGKPVENAIEEPRRPERLRRSGEAEQTKPGPVRKGPLSRERARRMTGFSGHFREPQVART